MLASVTQQSLGGHAIPVDAPIRRGLDRLGLIDDSMDDHAVRSLLERAVPKNRGAEFIDLMEELTHDTCVEGEPDCPRCELRKICPTGQEKIAAAKTAEKAAAKAARGKPAPEPPPAPAPAKATAPTKAVAAPPPSPSPKGVKGRSPKAK